MLMIIEWFLIAEYPITQFVFGFDSYLGETLPLMAACHLLNR